MIVRSILSLKDSYAFIMDGSEYREGHPTFHPFVRHDTSRCHLVVHSEIILLRHANNYILIEATDDDKRRLREAGYQMIGL
jgi:hypothetical protein